MSHLDQHNILANNQHGFRTKRSTETQLLTTIDDLAQSLDNKGHMDVLILDFTKAFDTVAHKRLLRKLEHYGVVGNTHRWITKWLTQRTQTVVVDGESSTAIKVGSGVPQGTVLGPLMFLLYINDIGDEVHDSKLRLFADDCLLYREIRTRNDEEGLQQDLDKLTNWAKKWQMSFNAKKCFQLKITNKKSPINTEYKMSGHVIERINHHPYLGVELAEKLSWGEHINIITQKANRSLNFIRRNLGRCSSKTKEMAYKSLVQPHLQYACAAWDPHQAQHIQKIEKIQSRAARFVTGNYGRYESVSTMKTELGWLPQQASRFVCRMTTLYKITNSHIAVSLPDNITPNTRVSRGHHDHQFTVPPAYIDSYKFSFFPRTIRCWNILPPSIISSPTPDAFKASIIKALKTKELYMVPPRDIYNRPRLGSSSDSLPGAMF